MAAFVVTFLLGIVCIVLGIFNMHGNISSLHSYHRHRVSADDRLPFGKKVGLGTILVGVGIMVFSVLGAVTLCTGQELYTLIGTIVLIASIAVGLAISVYAMIKYNKGVF